MGLVKHGVPGVFHIIDWMHGEAYPPVAPVKPVPPVYPVLPVYPVPPVAPVKPVKKLESGWVQACNQNQSAILSDHDTQFQRRLTEHSMQKETPLK